LRASGASIGLLAPAAGEALRGFGPGEVQELLRWEHPDVAQLASGELPDEGPLSDRLRTYEAAIAYTANDELVAALRRLIPVVHAFSPASLDPRAHASLALARPALALGGAPGIAPPAFRARPEDEAGVAEWSARLGYGFLALHPGSGSARKNWPGQRFAELADTLAADRPFLVVEGPADGDAGAPLRERDGAVVARELPLRTLGALLARAGLYVGNDSGVSHLAAAWGAPTLALFGPTDPVVWAPVGRFVRLLEAPAGDLDRLEAATVAASAKDALRSWGRPGLPCG
jgi:hypothetical protein